MLFNSSTVYSFKILSFLSQKQIGNRLNAKEISISVGLPKEYTAKILQILAKHKIVSSLKGKNGGFKLTMPIDTIYLGQLIEIFNKESFLSKCLYELQDECLDCYCPLLYEWSNFKKKIYDTKIIELESIPIFKVK